MLRRPLRRRAFVAPLGGAILPQVGGASAAAKRQETMQPETTVRVFNEDFLAATVYLVERGERPHRRAAAAADGGDRRVGAASRF